MNSRINKFLVWACIAYVIEFIGANLLIQCVSVFSVEQGLNRANMMLISSIAMIFSALPIRIVCGLWLKKEAEHMEGHKRIWFWTGFLFKAIGVILFYVYLTLNQRSKTENHPQ